MASNDERTGSYGACRGAQTGRHVHRQDAPTRSINAAKWVRWTLREMGKASVRTLRITESNH